MEHAYNPSYFRRISNSRPPQGKRHWDIVSKRKLKRKDWVRVSSSRALDWHIRLWVQSPALQK
jgi:hypothetical protein